MSAVHSPSLPTAQPGHRPQRLTLALLAAVFILPFVVGSGLFWSGWRPERFGQHGQLVEPPRALPESGLHQANGSALVSAELRGKWLLVLPVRDICAAPCLDNLQKMAQTQLALGKEQNRVRRVLLINRVLSPGVASAPPLPAQLVALQARFPGLVVADVPPDAADIWRSALDGDGGVIHVVDPHAKLMMRYPEGQDARGVLKDLERLIRVSWIR